jgi:hypothetical protein
LPFALNLSLEQKARPDPNVREQKAGPDPAFKGEVTDSGLGFEAVFIKTGI